MLPRNLPPRANARRASTALLLGTSALMLLSACADHSTLAVADAVHGRPQFSLSVPDGMSLECLPSPQVSSRAVAPGTDADLNGNGVVCVEQFGPPGLPQGAAPSPIITTDDLPLPSTKTTAGDTP